jgi:hypothetical protein
LIKIVFLNQAITLDKKHISQRTGKKIPLDVQTSEPHDCPARKNSQQQQQQLQQIQYSDITNATKTVARKYISMQTTRVKAGNSFHWTKIQVCHVNASNNINSQPRTRSRYLDINLK